MISSNLVSSSLFRLPHLFLLLIPSTVFFILRVVYLCFLKHLALLLCPVVSMPPFCPEILDLLYYYYSEFLFKEIASTLYFMTVVLGFYLIQLECISLY